MSLWALKNGGMTDILHMPYLYKSIVYGFFQLLLTKGGAEKKKI